MPTVICVCVLLVREETSIIRPWTVLVEGVPFKKLWGIQWNCSTHASWWFYFFSLLCFSDGLKPTFWCCFHKFPERPCMIFNGGRGFPHHMIGSSSHYLRRVFYIPGGRWLFGISSIGSISSYYWYAIGWYIGFDWSHKLGIFKPKYIYHKSHKYSWSIDPIGTCLIL